jgi:hypothetical protein
VSAAMNFVANADAVIFDMRGPGGGKALTVVSLESYLFDQPMHTVLDAVAGARQACGARRRFSCSHPRTRSRRGKSLPTTFRRTSAPPSWVRPQAEARTPFHPEKIDDRFTLLVPYGRAINPITKTNWEGAGVEPAVKVPEADALKAAKVLAAQKIASIPAGAASAGK